MRRLTARPFSHVMISPNSAIEAVTTQPSFSAAVACLGNVGPGFSKVGSMNNYATLNAATKAVGIMLMFLGRLEIFEILQLFYSHRSE